MFESQSDFARKLSEFTKKTVRQQHVWNWLERDKALPGEYAIPIEHATDGRVSRHDLRPDLYPVESTTAS